MTLQRTLPDLAKQINAGHATCLESARDTITGAIEVGRLLVEAKDQVRHGEWAAWVEAHCEFGIRQAQNYMRTYQNRERLEAQMRNGDSHLTSLRNAVAMLVEAKAQDVPLDDIGLLKKAAGVAADLLSMTKATQDDPLEDSAIPTINLELDLVYEGCMLMKAFLERGNVQSKHGAFDSPEAELRHWGEAAGLAQKIGIDMGEVLVRTERRMGRQLATAGI